MNDSFVRRRDYLPLAVDHIESTVRSALGVDRLPESPKDSARYPANCDPFWYRSMYMLAILAEDPHWTERGHEQWSRREIARVLSLTLETQLVSALRYRPVKRRLRFRRWAFFKRELELLTFLERVEPEVLVLLAGILARGEALLARPPDAAARRQFDKRSPHRRPLVERLRRVARTRDERENISLATYIVGFVVGSLESTPRGSYNLACYYSDGAQRARGSAEHQRWIGDAAGYLLDGLSGLDAGMDAWARVDPDLQELRRSLGGRFEELIRSGSAVRAAGLQQDTNQT